MFKHTDKNHNKDDLNLLSFQSVYSSRLNSKRGWGCQVVTKWTKADMMGAECVAHSFTGHENNNRSGVQKRTAACWLFYLELSETAP